RCEGTFEGSMARPAEDGEAGVQEERVESSGERSSNALSGRLRTTAVVVFTDGPGESPDTTLPTSSRNSRTL
ncbi:hypothetical protein, partial [Actinacidiphila glaucinigra]